MEGNSEDIYSPEGGSLLVSDTDSIPIHEVLRHCVYLEESEAAAHLTYHKLNQGQIERPSAVAEA